MRHALSKISTTAALGLAGAAALAVPAQAQEQWTPPALELASATCNADFEWELEWSLTDTTDTVNAPDDYTYTVAEVLTQIGADDFGPWEDAALDGSLQVGAVLPRTGEGSLTAVQTVPGDTERVKLKAQSDRTVTADGKRNEGRGLKNALQHAVELGDCTAPLPPEPEAIPEVDYGVGIVVNDGVAPEPEAEDVDAEWIVDIGVPPGVADPSTQYEIAVVTSLGGGTGTGTSGNPEVQTGQMGVGDSTVRIAAVGDITVPEDVFLELTVEDSAPPTLLLEVELPAIDAAPSTDPTPSADPVANSPDSATDASADSDRDSTAPTLPTTGLPLAAFVAVAVALLGAGMLALKRSRTREGRA
ncbi:hypothetical protein AB0K52_12460 [Glycomyces sp. NPDC049804]|uniref:hypothetical protein n=1 Tax=Glycomyces sp. NPDC049804 TaxID=3154363 RepID=UPI003422D5F9